MYKCRFVAGVNDYLDNQLAALAKAQFEEHLKVCSVCSGKVERLSKLREQLKTWQVPETGKGFESSVQNKIVAWELERGEEKMETKPSVILVPVGVLIGVVVFFFAGQVYFKGGVPRLIKSSTPVQLAQNVPISQTPASTAKPSMPVAELQKIYPQLLAKEKSWPIVQSGLSYMQNGMKEIMNGVFDNSIYSNLRESYSVLSPGVQYPPQSEFFEEEYSRIYDNDFLVAKESPLSTFSIDVDTAAYTNVRRFLNNNQLPPQDAVRIEEMINYFTYDYPQPAGSDPFSINTEIAVCPWSTMHKLVLVGLQGRKMEVQNLAPSNLVFLIDVSGSMKDYNKLPLLKSAFRLLVNQLRPQDKISIVVYAGSSSVVLDSVSGEEKDKIIQTIDELAADGSTAGAEGIVRAYEIAKKNFAKDGNNRVILATDGDFNIGITDEGELLRLIEERRDDGIFLTVLGFGMGNYKDAKMEKLADKGNGTFSYIDNLLEAKKVFVTQLTGTLFTIAKDVKIQVEFNPATVKAYRLIGYENRKLENKDFNDDKKDAGELGAGHTVTALYEVVPSDSKEEFVKTDDLKYQQVTVTSSDELLTVKLRYKDPAADTSKLLTKIIKAKEETVQPSENLRFASGVAEFGLLLRNSQYKADASYQSVLERVKAAKGVDSEGYRADLIKLVEIAQMLDTKSK